MKAYRVFWVFIVVLIALMMYASDNGALTWFSDNFSDPKTLVSSFFIVGIFLYGLLIVGHRAAQRLDKNEEAIHVLINQLPASISDEEKVSAVNGLFQKHAFYGLEDTAVSKSINDLGERVRTMSALSTMEPIDRGMFQEDFSDSLLDEILSLEAIRIGLFFVRGSLGYSCGYFAGICWSSHSCNG